MAGQNRGTFKPVVLNLSFRVRSNAMFTSERRYYCYRYQNIKNNLKLFALFFTKLVKNLKAFAVSRASNDPQQLSLASAKSGRVCYDNPTGSGYFYHMSNMYTCIAYLIEIRKFCSKHLVHTGVNFEAQNALQLTYEQL